MLIAESETATKTACDHSGPAESHLIVFIPKSGHVEMCFYGKLAPQVIFLRNSLSLNSSDILEDKSLTSCKSKIYMKLKAVEMLSSVLIFHLSR